MRLPSWLKTKRQRRVGNTVEVTLEVDTSAYVRELERAMARMANGSGVPMVAMLQGMGAFGRMARAAEEAGQALVKMQDTMNRDMATAVRRMVRAEEVRQAGLMARHYVRGGMDPAYADPLARDMYVQAIARNGPNGPACAAAFLRGWVEHRPEPVCSCQVLPERYHFVYYGATEPGSMWDWDPDCPVHRPSSGVR